MKRITIEVKPSIDPRERDKIEWKVEGEWLGEEEIACCLQDFQSQLLGKMYQRRKAAALSAMRIVPGVGGPS